MISGLELETLIAQGREQRAVEFKGPGRRDDKAFVARVARACIAISNLRDGGWVVIGVEDASPPVPVGLDAMTLATWTLYDDVASALARYCDPPVAFDHGIVGTRGLNMVVLQIKEFSEVPTLAARDYQEILQRGQIYVRGMSRIESTGRPSAHEIRAVIDLATEKGVRRFVEISQRSGMLSTAALGDANLADQKFEEQLGDLA